MLRREDVVKNAALGGGLAQANSSSSSRSISKSKGNPSEEVYEDQWLDWSGPAELQAGQTEREMVCPQKAYINRFAMRCGAKMDRLYEAECSDGTVLNFEIGSEGGAAHTILWLN